MFYLDRKGSVIADLQLTFNRTVGVSEVDALMKEVTKDGKLGELKVSEVVVGGPIEGKLLFFHLSKQVQTFLQTMELQTLPK